MSGAQNAERAAGQLAAGHEVQIRNAGGLNDFVEGILFEEVVCQTDAVRDLEQLVQGGPAQVRIHHEDALAALGKNRSQVENRGGFAFAGAGADNGDGVEFVVLP